MEGNTAATYTLIYNFLKKERKIKAAEAVKKAAKDIVIIKDDVEPDGPSLDDIVKQWKAPKQNNKASKKSDSSSEESSEDSESSSSSSSSSSSETSSSSDSESDDNSSDEDEAPKAKPLIPVKTIAGRDTSATLSSADEQRTSKRPEKTSRPTKKTLESESSDSEISTSESASDDSNASNSSSDSNDGENTKRKTTTGSRAAMSSSSESEDGSKAQKTKRAISTANVPKESATLTVHESTRVTKKRKISDTGTAAVTAIVTDSSENDETDVKPPHKSGKLPRKVNERFQRIKPHNMSSAPLLDNGYEAKGGTVNDYGQRAHRDLVVTRGAGFRKEKNKKKRGSYRGGEITLDSHEIKFED